MIFRALNPIFFFLLLTTPLTAAQWDGSTGDWNDPTKWDTGQVPGPGEEALIFTGRVTISSGTTVNIDKLLFQGGYLTIEQGALLHINAPFDDFAMGHIEGKLTLNGEILCTHQGSGPGPAGLFITGGLLSIGSSGRLSIHNTSGDALILINEARISNHGEVLIEDSQYSAMSLNSSSSVLNHGQFTIDGLTFGRAIINDSTSTISNNGQLLISNLANASAVSNMGGITNYGDILLQNCGWGGIGSSGTVRNYGNALIRLEGDQTFGSVMHCEEGAVFDNWGRLECMNSTGGTRAISCSGTVNNYENGILLVNSNHETAIKISEEGELNNLGLIDIAPTQPTHKGIDNEGRLENEPGAVIEISGDFYRGIQIDSILENYGHIEASSKSDVTLENNGFVYNQGYIEIKSNDPSTISGYFKLDPGGLFHNDGGTFIGRTTDHNALSWRNRADFINDNCGTVDFEGMIKIENSSSILNHAWFYTTADLHEIPDGDWINYGVIEDLQGALAGLNVSNYGLIADPLPGPVYTNSTISNALNFAPGYGVVVDSKWMTGPSYSFDKMGSYNSSTNELRVNSTAATLSTFYVNVTHDGCSRWIRVPVPGIILDPGPVPLMAAPGTGLVEENVRLYPNPSRGNVQANLPAAGIERDYRWSVHHLSGRLLLQGEWQAGGSRKDLNLQGLPVGTYVLKLQREDGHQQSERIVIQR